MSCWSSESPKSHPHVALAYPLSYVSFNVPVNFPPHRNTTFPLSLTRVAEVLLHMERDSFLKLSIQSRARSGCH